MSAWLNIDFGEEYEGLSSNPLSNAGHLYLNNEEIQDLIIPEDITEIKDYAFCEASGIKTVHLPNNIKYIGNFAFSGCNLTSVCISDLEAWYNIAFGDVPFNNSHRLVLNGTEIKDLVIPNNVTTIKNNAFYGCSGLTSITIPNSVEVIGNNAFYGCI